MITHRFGRAPRFIFRLPTHLYDWHAGCRLRERGARKKLEQIVEEVLGTERSVRR